MIKTGIDIVSIERMERSASNGRLVERIFTPAERAYSGSKSSATRHLAGRFAAKEAFLKALGTGLTSGIRWHDVEVLNGDSGRPLIRVKGEAARILDKRSVHISIAYSNGTSGRGAPGGAAGGLAVATVVIVREVHC